MIREEGVDEGPQEVWDDALMEFVNIVCGSAGSRAAELGHRVKIAPPEILHPGEEGIPIPGGEIGLLFPVHIVGDERVEFAIIISP